MALSISGSAPPWPSGSPSMMRRYARASGAQPQAAAIWGRHGAGSSGPLLTRGAGNGDRSWCSGRKADRAVSSTQVLAVVAHASVHPGHSPGRGRSGELRPRGDGERDIARLVVSRARRRRPSSDGSSGRSTSSSSGGSSCWRIGVGVLYGRQARIAGSCVPGGLCRSGAAVGGDHDRAGRNRVMADRTRHTAVAD